MLIMTITCSTPLLQCQGMSTHLVAGYGSRINPLGLVFFIDELLSQIQWGSIFHDGGESCRWVGRFASAWEVKPTFRPLAQACKMTWSSSKDQHQSRVTDLSLYRPGIKKYLVGEHEIPIWSETQNTSSGRGGSEGPKEKATMLLLFFGRWTIQYAWTYLSSTNDIAITPNS